MRGSVELRARDRFLDIDIRVLIIKESLIGFRKSPFSALDLLENTETELIVDQREQAVNFLPIILSERPLADIPEKFHRVALAKE